MKLHDVTALAIKISGIVLLVLTLSRIPGYVNLYLSFAGTNTPVNYLLFALPLLMVAIACVLLIFFPYKISNVLLFNAEATLQPSVLDNTILTIGIILLGILLLFWSVSDLAYHFFVYFLYRDSIDPSYSAATYDYPSLYATVVEFAFAAIMLLKSKTISFYLTSASK